LRNAAAAVRSLDYCYDIYLQTSVYNGHTRHLNEIMIPATLANRFGTWTLENQWPIWIDNREVYSKVRGKVMRQKYFENNESDIISLYLRTVNTTIYALWAQGLTTFVLYTCTFIDCPQVTLLREVDKAEIIPINKLF